ncbi:MAG: zinc ribbon domain-containing protein [bacterium]
MPVYEYECRKCGERHEFLESPGSPMPVKKCRKCGGVRFKRAVSGFTYNPPVTLEDLGVKVVPRYDYRPKGPPPGGCPYEKQFKEEEEKKRRKEQEDKKKFIL